MTTPHRTRTGNRMESSRTTGSSGEEDEAEPDDAASDVGADEVCDDSVTGANVLMESLDDDDGSSLPDVELDHGPEDDGGQVIASVLDETALVGEAEPPYTHPDPRGIEAP